MKQVYSFIISCFVITTAVCQTVTGKVLDVNTHSPVAYAAIGNQILGVGTLCDADGTFTLDYSKIDVTDTIKVFAIGYEIYATTVQQAVKNTTGIIYLKPVTYELEEVKIKPKQSKYLGTYKYTKNNCSAFAGTSGNWKGNQAAIKANNKEGVKVYLESFGFYIIKNEYSDSLTFRMMLYSMDANGYPGPTFLKQPVIFKTNVKQGEVRVDLKPYQITTTGDFFISLECLEDEMESAKFCFAGTIDIPSYFKNSAFSKWGKVKGGGGDFNLKVSYSK